MYLYYDVVHQSDATVLLYVLRMHVVPTVSSLVQRICRCWINNAYNIIIMSDTNTTNQSNLRFIKTVCQQGHANVD